MNRLTLTILITLIPILSSHAIGDVILDADFFTDIPHTLITFETDGSGDPVNLPNGHHDYFPKDEYAAFGFSFNKDIEWVNDGSGAFYKAQLIGGSPDISIPGPENDAFRINFSSSVRSFGFFVINSLGADAPVFEAYGVNGLIETVAFTAGE